MYCEKMIFTGRKNLPDFSVWHIEAVRTGIFVLEMVIYSESRQINPIRESKSISRNIII